MVDSVSEVTDRRMVWLPAEEIVGQLNRKLTGWANYFCLGPVSPAYRTLDEHVRRRLRRWLCKKHKVLAVVSISSGSHPQGRRRRVLAHCWEAMFSHWSAVPFGTSP